eukprot:UN10134
MLKLWCNQFFFLKVMTTVRFKLCEAALCEECRIPTTVCAHVFCFECSETLHGRCNMCEIHSRRYWHF